MRAFTNLSQFCVWLRDIAQHLRHALTVVASNHGHSSKSGLTYLCPHTFSENIAGQAPSTRGGKFWWLPLDGLDGPDGAYGSAAVECVGFFEWAAGKFRGAPLRRAAPARPRIPVSQPAQNSGPGRRHWGHRGKLENWISGDLGRWVPCRRLARKAAPGASRGPRAARCGRFGGRHGLPMGGSRGRERGAGKCVR